MSGLKRAAIVFGVLALLLLVDGIYLVATHTNPNGDTGTFFGNQHYALSSGTIVLISALLLAVAALVMWLVDVHREDRERAQRPAAERQAVAERQQAAEKQPVAEPLPAGDPATPEQPPTREQPGPSGRTASHA
jgi:hypothetical protein